jgi:hypothetical protein
MKSTLELEVTLLGLRVAARIKKTPVDPGVNLWVEEALARNYWRHLCEREETGQFESPAPGRCDADQGVAGNAAW